MKLVGVLGAKGTASIKVDHSEVKENIVLPAPWSKWNTKKAACSFRMLERSCFHTTQIVYVRSSLCLS